METRTVYIRRDLKEEQPLTEGKYLIETESKPIWKGQDTKRLIGQVSMTINNKGERKFDVNNQTPIAYFQKQDEVYIFNQEELIKMISDMTLTDLGNIFSIKEFINNYKKNN